MERIIYIVSETETMLVCPKQRDTRIVITIAHCKMFPLFDSKKDFRLKLCYIICVYVNTVICKFIIILYIITFNVHNTYFVSYMYILLFVNLSLFYILYHSMFIIHILLVKCI